MARRVRKSQPSPTTLIVLDLDGDWTAEELSAMLRSLEDLYNLLIVLNSLLLRRHVVRESFFPIDRRNVRRMAFQFTDESALRVPRIQYSSPGLADLLGAGETIKQIKEFLFGITDRVLDRKKRALDIQQRELEIMKLKNELEFARSEQRLVLDNRKRAIDADQSSRELELAKKAEEVRALELSNLSKELAFTSAVQKAFKANRLNHDEQSACVKWIGSRARPLLELIDKEKLKGVKPEPEGQ
jgi:hypothetical protein